MSEMKPCPFCGGTDLRVVHHDIDGWIAYIQCCRCDGEVRGPDSEYKYDDKDEASEDAAARWNLRATSTVETEATIAALKAENERLLVINEDHCNSVNTYIARVSALEDAVSAFQNALTPSAETKAAYIGEVRQRVRMTDPSGEEYSQDITVDWTSTKAVMKLIRDFSGAAARAALTKQEG